MRKNERLEQILEILNEHTYISNQKLCDMLYVSLPTIRRDLNLLQKQELVVRSHGGAKLLGAKSNPFDFRSTYNTSLKKELCKKAAALISDGDVIYIDSSSTVAHIAEFITAEGVVAVTNSLPAAENLRQHNIATYFAGGKILPSSQCCTGSYVEDFLRDFNFSIAFFSSYGINSLNMIVDTSLPETAVRKIALKNAKRKVFLCDKNKINTDAPYNVIDADEVDDIITNF